MNVYMSGSGGGWRNNPKPRFLRANPARNTDERLRDLERSWRLSGVDSDRLAYLKELERTRSASMTDLKIKAALEKRELLMAGEHARQMRLAKIKLGEVWDQAEAENKSLATTLEQALERLYQSHQRVWVVSGSRIDHHPEAVAGEPWSRVAGYIIKSSTGSWLIVYRARTAADRAQAENELQEGADEITYHGQTFFVDDNERGWSYSINGNEFDSLDAVLDYIDNHGARVGAPVSGLEGVPLLTDYILQIYNTNDGRIYWQHPSYNPSLWTWEKFSRNLLRPWSDNAVERMVWLAQELGVRVSDLWEPNARGIRTVIANAVEAHGEGWTRQAIEDAARNRFGNPGDERGES